MAVIIHGFEENRQYKFSEKTVRQLHTFRANQILFYKDAPRSNANIAMDWNQMNTLPGLFAVYASVIANRVLLAYSSCAVEQEPASCLLLDRTTAPE